MTEILACCGLVCDTCPIHLATLQKDRKKQAEMRAEIVRMCKEHYGLSYTIEDITDCDGCRTDGERLFSVCEKCLVRRCVREKRLENCAMCTEFACDKLETVFRMDPEAKIRLVKIKETP